MPYSHITWPALRTQLGNRLRVSALSATSYWTDTECGNLLAESFRTWSSITGYWKQRETFSTETSVPFYDLSSKLPTTVFDRTITDRDLIKDLQFALLESTSSQSTWAGTEMFTLADLTQAIQRRRNQLLVETGIVVTSSSVNVPSAPIGRVQLGDSVIDIRWASWLDVGGIYGRLQRSDEFAFNAFRRNWSVNPSTPQEYSVAVTPPLAIQLAPVPSNVGTLQLLTVNAGAALAPETSATVLGIPDDLVWVVKWGVLADLLGRSGLSEDRMRASYCEQRWREGVEIARMQPSVLGGEINGVPVQIGSLEDLERFKSPYWRNATSKPDSIGMCGHNMVALANVPDSSGPYSVTVDIVRKAPVPISEAEQVQIGREELDTILDYSEHLAVFKQGGSTLTDSIPLMKNFYRMASVHNQRMRANATFYEALGDRAIRPKEQHPRRSPRETQDVEEAEAK